MGRKTPPAKILNLWLRQYIGTSTREWSDRYTAMFLAHECIPSISNFPLEAIRQELPHHQKLEDLLKGLRTKCHQPRPKGGSKKPVPKDPSPRGPKPPTPSSRSRWDGSDKPSGDWRQREMERKAARVDFDRPEPYN